MKNGIPNIDNMVDLVRADNDGQDYHIKSWTKNKQKRISKAGLDFVYDFAQR